MAGHGSDPQFLKAIVDMGSNGIRFSITSLQPPLTRILPTLYQHRAAISLYDAQYTPSTGNARQAIDETTIAAVLRALDRFRRVCAAFRVPDANVRILATEATRTAINSDEFRSRIENATGWKVTLLSKADEGRIGAMGVASSLPEIKGLVMDLGGGSTQLSFVSGKWEVDGIQAVSLPYGAAALMRRLDEAEKGEKVAELREEVKGAIQGAFNALRIPPDELREVDQQHGFTLYLSGGGFRGWGYLLISHHPVSPYPIPVINGFHASRKDFFSTNTVKLKAEAALQDDDSKTFRVSDRRASQVPAVAFLIDTLVDALPLVKEVRFCQGGVREGYLFDTLPEEIKLQHPLLVATQPFKPSSSDSITELLEKSLPPQSPDGTAYDHRTTFTSHILGAFANLLFYHATHSKDLQAAAALRSTTSGILAGTHGILHESRILLALLLCARWGGDVPPVDQAFKTSLEKLLPSRWTEWWIRYLGAVASLVAAVYPAGIVDSTRPQLQLGSRWDVSKKARTTVTLRVGFATNEERAILTKELENIEKVGKRKNFLGPQGDIGYKVVLDTALLDE